MPELWGFHNVRHHIALLGLAVGLLVAPSAVAVHGAPYTASGVALGPDGVVYNAVVHWTGWWQGSFQVTITDSATGAQLLYDSFRGRESWNGPVIYSTEFFKYKGESIESRADFLLEGYQIINISTGYQTMGYVGHYEDYQLILYV